MTTPTTKIKSLLDSIQRVEVGKLKVHPRNPRKGDVDRIAQSLEANSQYRPLVVQESTGYVIAGNHTYLGARKLGWTHVDVVYINVNDKQARKIMLADNRTSDAGTYDDNILAEVLRSLEGDVAGTGYYDEEIDKIIAGTSQLAEETLRDFENTDLQRRFNDSPLGSEDEDDTLESGPADFGGRSELAGGEGLDEDEEDGPALEAAAEQLGGMMNFKNPDEVEFPKIGYWQMPELDQTKFMRFEELPPKLVTWAESFSRNKIDPHANDPETWWFFNWGMSSSQGMDDISKVIISFYSPDNVFENWWAYPERYAAKVVNSGIKYMVAPDFSIIGDDSRTIWLHQLYRSRWTARYMQECGIKIIPNVSIPVTDTDFTVKHILGTLPVGLPMIAMQMQTWDQKDIEENLPGGLAAFVKIYQTVFDVLKPKGFLLYAGAPGQRFFEQNIDTHCPVRVLDSRLMRLSEFDTQRKRKKTI